MKINHIKGLFVAGLATILMACSQSSVEDEVMPQGEVAVKFAAQMPTTRADISVDESTNRFTGHWEEGDEVLVSANTQSATMRYGASKYFEGTLQAGTAPWTYQATSPAVATATPLSIPFGKVRVQQGNHFNHLFDAMVSDKVMSQGEVGKTEAGDPIQFNFKRLTSILALTFTTSDADVQGEEVKAIRLFVNEGEQLSDKSFNIDKEAMTGALSKETPMNEIVMDYAVGTRPTAQKVTAYFNIPAGKYTQLKAQVITANHTSKEILLRNTFTSVEGKLYYKTMEVSEWLTPATPSVEWATNPDFERVEIQSDMAGKCNIVVNAPANVETLKINITSAFLNGINLHTLDLINPGELGEFLTKLNFPCGEKLKAQQQISFDLATTLSLLVDQVGDHVFELDVTDYLGRNYKKALTFFVPITVSMSDVNLWTNTATLTMQNAPEGATVQYRRVGAPSWVDAVLQDGKLQMLPTWGAAQSNGAKTLNNDSGVFAGATYEWQVISGGTAVAKGQFDPMPTGDAIPELKAGLPCFGTSNSKSTEWASGNNSFAKKLCTFDDKNGNYVLLKPIVTAGKLAAGNLFMGTFNFASFSGKVGFGQQYPYTARPTAIEVNYQATVSKVTHVSHKMGNAPDEYYPLEVGQDDQAAIIVCIVDWSARHETTSGIGGYENVWDPETKEGLTEDEQKGLIAYGVKYLTGNSSDAALKIPLHYYQDTSAAPASSHYTIVISCASSRYGDYMCGSKDNELRVKDFKWVY